MDGVRAAALQYHNWGLNVIPIKESGKEPLVLYSQYTYRKQTERDIHKLFPNESLNIGVLTGDCSENLFILDFDSETGYQTALQNERFQKVVEQTTVITSGREAGGHHVFFRAPVPVKSMNVKELDLNLKGDGGYCVAPPSQHPSGRRYTVERWGSIYCLQDLQELPFLRLVQGERRLDSPLSRLTDSNWKHLYFWLNRTPRGKRSEAEMRAVVLLVSCGCSFQEIQAFFEHSAGEESKYKEKEGYKTQYLRVCYDNACGYLTSVRQTVQRLIEIADSDWVFPNLRTRGTDRAVSHAIISIVQRTGKTDIGISVRELAELAGISVPTAMAGLRRTPFLDRSEDGLTILHRATKFHSAVYRVREPVPSPGQETGHCFNTPHILFSLKTVQNMSASSTLFAHDAFRNKALGKTGAAIIRYLSEKNTQVFTARSISDGTGIHRKTVERKLTVLVRMGILKAEGENRGRTFTLLSEITHETLTRIAETCGTYGKGEMQRKQHQDQREKFRDKKTNITGMQEISNEEEDVSMLKDIPLTEPPRNSRRPVYVSPAATGRTFSPV